MVTKGYEGQYNTALAPLLIVFFLFLILAVVFFILSRRASKGPSGGADKKGQL